MSFWRVLLQYTRTVLTVEAIVRHLLVSLTHLNVQHAVKSETCSTYLKNMSATLVKLLATPPYGRNVDIIIPTTQKGREMCTSINLQ
jgi:hypothetical protein